MAPWTMRFMTQSAAILDAPEPDEPMPVGTRGVRIAPISNRRGASTWNAEDLTFEFVLATETPCRSYRWSERDRRYYEVDEVLLMSGIRDVQALVGKALLNSHQSWGLDKVLGVIEAARTEGGKLICKARMSRRPEIASIRDDVADGILTNFSVGFDIHSDDEMQFRGGGKNPLVEVTDWQPVEGSIVPVPADPNANIRSGGIAMTAIRTQHGQRSEKELTEEEKKALAEAEAAAKKEEEAAEEKARSGVLAGFRSAFSALESFLGGKREAPAVVVTSPPAQVAPPAAVAGERANIVAGLRSIAVANQRGKEFDALALDPEVPIRELREMALLSVRTSAAEIAPFSSSPDNSSGERERTELPTAHEFRAERAKRAAGRN